MSEKKAVTVKKTVQSANKADGNKTAGFCVYLGPSIMGVIQSGTIYSGTKNEVLTSIASAVEKYPLIASLIVSNDTLPEDRIKVKTPGNLLYVNYHKLVKGKE